MNRYRSITFNLLVFLLLLCFSCTKEKQHVDLIVHNANIYTVDDGFSKATSFAVKDGKFVAVLSSNIILDAFTSETILDAQGLTILPGLIDAHCHFYGLGLSQQIVDLVGTKSFDEVLQRVQDFQEKNPSNFIRGRGWDQNDWEEKEFPTKDRLDALFPDLPVALRRVDGHALLVNQKALDMAGVTNKTKVSGGEIILKNGKLTGVLVDTPMQFIVNIIPPPSRATQIQALKDAEALCIDYGLTTVNDAGISRNTIELIDSLQQANALSMRVYAMVSNNPEEVAYYLKKGIVKTDRLNVRSVKVYGDGALGSRGAALREPYADQEGHFGAMITTPEELEYLALKIADSDYQMNTHAIGDSSNISVLRAYKKALEGKQDRRWKVEHAQVISMQDFDYFENGIIPSIQPTHATSDMYWAGDRLGAAREQGAYAYKLLLEKAGLVVLGTDFPVEKVSPFLTFYAAVVRKDLDNYPEGGYQMKDALTREETLKGMTIWAAYSNFEEHEKGSIAVGKLADFVILSADIMEVSEQEIPKVTAKQVFIGGKKVK
ncbi:MAG: amidohydrolase [Flavobacteriaceae bacterium]|nr:MAG: amidohydrolase [Flavobacteriaceae bacterium]